LHGKSEWGGEMKRHLVLVGGGHAHLTVMLKVDEFVRRGHRVTLISPSPYHYYSGMGPGMLSGIYRPEDIRFHASKMVQDRGAAYIEGTVKRVDPKRRKLFLSTRKEIEYDVVSFNIGSSVPTGALSGVNKNIITVKPIVNLLRGQQTILELLQKGEPRLLVIGGGPAGLEISANCWRLVHNHTARAHITLVAGPQLLPSVPQKVRQIAIQSLASRGIQVTEGSLVTQLKGGRALTEDGREFPFDLALLALGVKPAGLFKESGLPIGDDGGLLVNEYLQSLAYPEIFGGGDCISFEPRPLVKVGVYAVRQNPILSHNLMAALEGGDLRPFDPGGAYLLIFNLGDGTGVFFKKGWVFDGRLAFYLKDYIDNKFMKRFQVSGERTKKEE
jgi:NADH dehydrogenase FAD-containing subunit